jgi:hypothetical protein
MDMLALYVDRLNMLPDHVRSEVKRAGIKASGRKRVPYYAKKRPFHHLENVGPRDLRILHAVVRGMVIANDRGWLDPGAAVRPRLRLMGDPLVPAGEPGDLEVRRAVASGDVPPDAAAHPGGSEPLSRPAWTVDPQELDGLPRLGETWSGDPAELAHTDDYDPDALPAPGDLEAWKAVDRRLISRAMHAISLGQSGLKRLTARYFGGADPRNRLMERLDESPELPFLMSFQEWLWLDYRKNNRDPTLAERMLAGSEGGPLSRAERVVLEALSLAPMSLQRVVSVVPDRYLVLEDVLRGGQCEVTDHSLSRMAKPGQVFSGRVYSVGSFYFASGVGLVLPPLLVSAALAQLRQWGLRTTPAALRRGAHLFGRLWDFVFEQPTLPRIKTTDGEDMVLHEATFRVRSPDIARASLRSHPDYEHDPSADTYVWVEARPGATVDPVVLGRFQLEGDHLRFFTNSAPRWERARAWVERAMPGAVLEDLQRHDATSIEQAMAAGPAAGVDPAARPPEPELSAEDMDALRKFVQEKQLQWIDHKIPMLGGQTPREAVRTKGGRRQVQQLLRTLPAAMGPGDTAIEPPLAEIRRQLGLPPEDEIVSTTGLPSGTMFDDRNARKRARRKQKKGGRKGSRRR